MASRRLFRLIEASLIVLFFLEALRAVFAILLQSLNIALNARIVDPLLTTGHVFLFLALGLPWLLPRNRLLLPRFLFQSAFLAALSRLAMTVPLVSVRLFSALLLIGVSGIYLSSLLRANYRTWVSSLVAGLALDQLLRARDTFGLLTHTTANIPMGPVRLVPPIFIIQLLVTVGLISLSIAARRSARLEPYRPASLGVLGGLALGGFLALQFSVLGMPNVVARWSEIPYAVVVPLVMGATVLPLVPGIRSLGSEILQIFDDRLRGWIWLFAILLMIVVGNRFVGLAAVFALSLAQFMAVMLLWWIPVHNDSDLSDSVGPSISIGVAGLFVLIYVYSFSIGTTQIFSIVRGQALTVVLVAGAALGLARLSWQEDDPWRAEEELPRLLPAVFAAPMVILALVISGAARPQPPPSLGDGLRIATYNINRGYDEAGDFSLEATARTIEASLADVIVLQEVAAGSPLSYGIDEAEYIARRMGMWYAYLPTYEYSEGIAILSRWPITEQTSVLFPTDPTLGAMRVRFFDAASGRSLDAIGAQMLASSEELRLQQTALIFSIVDQNVPSILALDMDAGPLDPAYQQLTATSFVDPDVALGIERGFTTPAKDPTMRYDYVLVRGLAPEDSRQVRSDQEASDHRLVVVSVRWP